MSDEIHVKVSGSAVYRAVKNYLDNSEEMKATIQKMVDKHLETAVKGRIESMLRDLDMNVRYKIKTEVDALVKKEVEAKVAAYISKGIQKMFEGEVTAKVTEVVKL